MIRRLIAAVTCLSCGAPWGQPHAPNCAFETVACALALRGTGVPA
jgi:hypothetical protein